MITNYKHIIINILWHKN